MAMLPHSGARLQPSILVGVVLRTNRGIQCTCQCYVPVNANVYISSSAQAAIMESACAIFELETFSLCTLLSAVVGVVQVYLQPFFTSALGVSEWSASRLTREDRNFCSVLNKGLSFRFSDRDFPIVERKTVAPFLVAFPSNLILVSFLFGISWQPILLNKYDLFELLFFLMPLLP